MAEWVVLTKRGDGIFSYQFMSFLIHLLIIIGSVYSRIPLYHIYRWMNDLIVPITQMSGKDSCIRNKRAHSLPPNHCADWRHVHVVESKLKTRPVFEIEYLLVIHTKDVVRDRKNCLKPIAHQKLYNPFCTGLDIRYQDHSPLTKSAKKRLFRRPFSIFD